MIVQGVTTTAPAAGSIANALSGTGVEFIGKASLIDLLATADTAGDTFSLTYTVGGDSKVMVPAGTSINVASAAGVGPQVLNDVYLQDYPVPAGSHLVLAVTAASTHVDRFRVVVKP